MDHINAVIIVLIILIILYLGLWKPFLIGAMIGFGIAWATRQQTVSGGMLLPEIDDETEIELIINNMNSIYFNNIKQYLENEKYEVDITNSIVAIDTSSHIRKISGEQLVFQRKESEIIYKSSEYKVRRASEIIVQKPNLFNPSIIRRRYRRSYLLDKYPNVRFDLTIINDDKYEVEIEMINDIRMEELQKMGELCINVMFAVGMKISTVELLRVIESHNTLVSQLSKTRPSKITRGYENKPQDLKPSDLINDYYLTLKYDGVRHFMLILTEGTYLIIKDAIYKIGEGDTEWDGTLIDGELMTDSKDPLYSAFDILIHKGVNITNKSFDERYKLISGIDKLDTMIECEIKPFFTKGSTMTRIKEALDLYDKKEREYDGLILQPTDGYYTKTKKWKPSHLLTIDFLVQACKQKGVVSLHAYDHNGNHIFKGTKNNPFSGIVKGVDPKYIGNIVEFEWKVNTFKPMRMREDRFKPNSMFVAKVVFDRIHEPIGRKTLLGEDLTLIRRYNQTQKLDIMKKHMAGGTILDIGSGRGADLSKWNKLNLDRVLIVEPDKEVLNILDGRKKNMHLNYDLTILNTGAEDTVAIKKSIGNELFDSVNTFYSLTFFFRDKNIFDGLMKTFDLIKTGGKIIGSVMDGGQTMKLLKGGKFENAAFRIDAPDAKLGEFGQKVKININDPNSMIKDVEEYLFDFEYFSQVLLSNKFKLIENYFYSDAKFKTIPDIQKKFGNLFRVFVFEKV